MGSWLNRHHQCAIPVFDGLLPEPHNSAILRLLFTCAHWHGLAKLRMHTDQTLDIFDNVTLLIGADFRAFADKTCPAFETKELAREAAARQRRGLKKAQDKGKAPTTLVSDSNKQSQQEAQNKDKAPVPLASDSNGQPQQGAQDKGKAPACLDSDSKGQSQQKAPQSRRKKFGLRSYKYHSLGDYPATIRRFGTTDSYSTEPVGSNCSLYIYINTLSRVN